jgi:hypothetical protein
MNLETLFDIYELISSCRMHTTTRKQSFNLRKRSFHTLFINKSIIKTAFDTRRINQETTFNPRRGLQNYHRSEPFISMEMKKKIEAFAKLSKILDQIKLEYEREPQWQDSYVRVLSSAVHKGLRTLQSDGDFSDVQPSMASLAYLEELIYVRYRLTTESLMSMTDLELRNSVLRKDELLVNGGISSLPIIPSDISKNNYDDMLQKVLTSVAQMMSQMKSQGETKSLEIKPKDSEKTVTININV